MGTSSLSSCPVAAGLIREATITKRKRGVALNLSVRVATPLYKALKLPIKSKPYEPTSIGKLVGLMDSDYSFSPLKVNIFRVF